MLKSIVLMILSKDGKHEHGYMDDCRKFRLHNSSGFWLHMRMLTMGKTRIGTYFEVYKRFMCIEAKAAHYELELRDLLRVTEYMYC